MKQQHRKRSKSHSKRMELLDRQRLTVNPDNTPILGMLSNENEKIDQSEPDSQSDKNDSTKDQTERKNVFSQNQEKMTNNDDIEFFNLVGHEHVSIRVCNIPSASSTCPLVTTSDHEQGSGNTCIMCKRYLVKCVCGNGAGSEGDQYCYDRTDCIKLGRAE